MIGELLLFGSLAFTVLIPVIGDNPNDVLSRRRLPSRSAGGAFLLGARYLGLGTLPTNASRPLWIIRSGATDGAPPWPVARTATGQGARVEAAVAPAAVESAARRGEGADGRTCRRAFWARTAGRRRRRARGKFRAVFGPCRIGRTVPEKKADCLCRYERATFGTASFRACVRANATATASVVRVIRAMDIASIRISC